MNPASARPAIAEPAKRAVSELRHAPMLIPFRAWSMLFLCVLAPLWTMADTTSDLKAYWPFTHGLTLDVTSHGYDGFGQDVYATSDRHGNTNSALLFNGTSSVVEIGNSFAMLDQQTVVAWVNPSVIATTHPIVEKAIPGFGAETEFQLFLQDNGRMQWAVVLDNGGTGTFAQATGTSLLPVAQWSFVAGVIDRANNQLRIYVNGVLDATAPMGGFGVRNQNLSLRIGKRVGNAATHFFNGAIDEVRIYDRTLAPAEIVDVMIISSPSSPGPNWDYGNGRHGSYTLAASTTIEQLYQAIRLPGDPLQYNPNDPTAVPNFRSFTITNNATLSGTAFNGTSGGKIVCKVQGAMIVASGASISADGIGYRGGSSYQQGESYAGSQGNSQNANFGGGGGAYYYHPRPGVTSYAHAAGGGYGSGGASGTAFQSGASSGGNTYGSDSIDSLSFGSGGGGGYDMYYSSPVYGGRGGGAIAINSGYVEIDGTVSANGGGGGSPSVGNGYLGLCGGGGSGGSISLRGNRLVIGANNVKAIGGNGGQISAFETGGGGGVGRIRIAYSTSFDGTATPSASAAFNQSNDIDGDGVPDSIEWGSNVAIPRDSDGDGIPDYLDTDSNNNGIPDSVELGTDGLVRTTDTDGDGIPDYWESFYGLNPSSSGDANTKPPGDNLSYFLKYRYGLNPSLQDNDGDGINDYDEIFVYGTNPLKTDTDGDGMPDVWEIAYGLNPLVNDGNEDADLDGLSNLEEYQAGTDPQARFTGGSPANDLQRVKGASQQYAAYDANNRLRGVQYSNGIGFAFTYDGNGNITRQFTVNADADNDGLPDVWELANGLSTSYGAGDDGPYGDPDHDGWTNYQEWKTGTNPRDANSHPDLLTTPAAQLRQTPTLARLLPATTTLGALPTLNLKLWDGEGNSAKVVLQYFDAISGQWKDATLTKLDGSAYNAATAVAALPGGTAHTLLWNAWQDLGSSFKGNALLRVRADDFASTGAWSEPVSVAVNMGVDTNGDGVPDRWAMQYGLDPNGASAAQTDTDRDGLSDFLEYALNTHPRLASPAGQPVTSIEGGYLTLTVARNAAATALQFHIAVSADLATWFSDAAHVTILQDTPTLLKARDNVPITAAPKRYIRLEVVSQ